MPTKLGLLIIYFALFNSCESKRKFQFFSPSFNFMITTCNFRFRCKAFPNEFSS